MRYAFTSVLGHQVFSFNAFRPYFTCQNASLHFRHIRPCANPALLLKYRTVPAKRHISVFEVEKEKLRSFVKDLYVNDVDAAWAIPFPTLEDSRDLESFNGVLKSLAEFFTEREINSAKLDDEAEIPTDLIHEMKNLRLFGLAIPQKYGGMELSNLKLAKIFEEISTADNSVNMMIASHNLLGAQPILKYGNDEQKEKYLPKLASGDMIAAFCCNEMSAGSDINMMKTRARLSEDGSHWLLSGEKTSINNGGIADLMIVFAKIQVGDVDNRLKDTIGAFIVEKSFGGIYNGPQEDKMGMRALNTSDIMFDETPVPLGNMIGEERDGFKIATDTLHDARLGLACGIIGPMRRLLQDTTKHANDRVQFGRTIKDFDLVREKISQIAEDIYAMESVAYLTMGKYDQAVEEEKIPDLSVESAVAKVFLAQKASEITNNCMELVGHRAYTKSLPYERILRDVKMFNLSEGTTDILKLYIALSCFKRSETAVENRMRHYKHGTMRMWFQFFVDNNKSDNANKYVRKGFLRKKIPSFNKRSGSASNLLIDWRLNDSSEHIEELTVGLFRKVYNHLRHFGNSLQDEQQRLRIFADLAISLYCMVAVLSRCNKSLQLGFQDSEREYLIATAFIYKKFRECGLAVEEVFTEFVTKREKHVFRVGTELLEERRYGIAHPLELEHKFIENPIHLKHFEKVLKSLPK